MFMAFLCPKISKIENANIFSLSQISQIIHTIYNTIMLESYFTMNYPKQPGLNLY